MLPLLIGVVYLALLSVSVEAAVNCPPVNVRSKPFCTCEEYSKRPGTIQLDCGYLPSNGDSIVGELLDTFINAPNSFSPLVSLVARNNLTRIPEQIRRLPKLEYINLNHNRIKSIESGAFNYDENVVKLISVEVNGLETIAPGAFKGNGYGKGTQIVLSHSNLKRFESTVFKSILEKMVPFSNEDSTHTYISIYQNVHGDNPNLFECDCHLAWLIRDNRHLLPAVNGGKCSNGTWFESLDPNGFAACPSFVCPLGYDGNYADPLSNSKYYSCIGNRATSQNCPNDFVFNSETSRCDAVANLPRSALKAFTCPSADGQFENTLSCDSYYLCIDNDQFLVNCPPSFVFNPLKKHCDKPKNVAKCNK